MLQLALESLAMSGHLRLRVNGTSMVPFLYPGSLVRIRRSSLERIAAGDVVLVRCESGVQLHRVRSVTDGLVVTRGDGLDQDDPPRNAADVLGVLEEIEETPGLLRRLHIRWQLRNAA